jgi:hypothetical protein
MALIVFFRGINVGGHRTLRPTMLAKELATYDVVNVGAAGTFVVRKPGTQARFLAELRRKLPFDAVVAFCDSSDLSVWKWTSRSGLSAHNRILSNL